MIQLTFSFKDYYYKLDSATGYFTVRQLDRKTDAVKHSHSTDTVKRFFEDLGVEDYRGWLSDIYRSRTDYSGCWPYWFSTSEEDNENIAVMVAKALNGQYNKVMRKCSIPYSISSTNLLLLV